MNDFKVSLIGCVNNPQTIAVAGALSCFESKSSEEICRELLEMPREARIKKEEAVLKNSLGKGHGSVGDQSFFVFSIKDLPRLATLQLCTLGYLAHLQQSLRRADANRGCYIPEVIKDSSIYTETMDVLNRSFRLYEEMKIAGIPAEDARFLLPLSTKTNIQTSGNARELCHLYVMSQDENVPTVVKAVVEEMILQASAVAPYLFKNFGPNYERLAWYPAGQLYGGGNEILREVMGSYVVGNQNETVNLVGSSTDFSFNFIESVINKAIHERDETALSALKHTHFSFLLYMSVACLHQAIRQRTWDHSLESIYGAAVHGARTERMRMVIPPSINYSNLQSLFKVQHRKMLNLYVKLVENGIPAKDAIGVVPHSLGIYTLVHINGWNAISAIGKRTCTTAQWKIRGISQKMAEMVKKEFPALGAWAEPQCVIYGKCPEAKECGYYQNQSRKT